MRPIMWFPRLLAVCLAGASACANPAAAETSPPVGAPELAKVACWFKIPKDFQVDCYRLPVPETRAFDKAVGPGQTLSLPVVIIRAGSDGAGKSSGAPALDPVVYLAGGPGDGSWLDNDRIDWWWDYIGGTDWARKRDLILFDQRGSGLVEPRIDCPEIEDIALQLLTMTDDAAAAKLQREAAAACARRLVEIGRAHV